MPVTIRTPGERDVFQLMNLYQQAVERPDFDPLFLDWRRLAEDLRSERTHWRLVERRGEAVGLIAWTEEAGQGLSKITRLHIHPGEPDHGAAARRLLEVCLEANENRVDAIYATTRFMPFARVRDTEALGFHLLGLFPFASSDRWQRVNAISARFAPAVLDQRRQGSFPLHPRVRALFDLVRTPFGLPPAPAAAVPAGPGATAPLPPLELIVAPRFVARHFERLREQHRFALDFYPFQLPNTLITAAESEVEVFVALAAPLGFAAIIVERFELPVDPVALYREVARLIHDQGIPYVEMIVDAADIEGIEVLLQAGFLPCAYFPCLKRHGGKRRDFLILGQSFQKLRFVGAELPPAWEPFLAFYADMEKELVAHPPPVPSAASGRAG